MDKRHFNIYSVVFALIFSGKCEQKKQANFMGIYVCIVSGYARRPNQITTDLNSLPRIRKEMKYNNILPKTAKRYFIDICAQNFGYNIAVYNESIDVYETYFASLWESVFKMKQGFELRSGSDLIVFPWLPQNCF